MDLTTPGDKLYPEDVEEALRRPTALDVARMVGVPDAKWGQAAAGVVVLAGGVAFDEDDVRRRVRAGLAGRKAPKRILGVQPPLRASSGKADYKAITEFARRDVGLGS